MTWAPCPHGVRTRGKKKATGEAHCGDPRTLQRFWTSFLGPPAEHVLASVVIQLFWHGVMMDVLHAWCFFVGRLFVVRPFGWVEGVALRGQLHIWWVACVVARWGLLRRIFRTIC